MTIAGLAIAIGITATVIVLIAIGARPAPWWIQHHRDLADLPETDEADPEFPQGRPSSS